MPLDTTTSHGGAAATISPGRHNFGKMRSTDMITTSTRRSSTIEEVVCNEDINAADVHDTVAAGCRVVVVAAPVRDDNNARRSRSLQQRAVLKKPPCCSSTKNEEVELASTTTSIPPPAPAPDETTTGVVPAKQILTIIGRTTTTTTTKKSKATKSNNDPGTVGGGGGDLARRVSNADEKLYEAVLAVYQGSICTDDLLNTSKHGIGVRAKVIGLMNLLPDGLVDNDKTRTLSRAIWNLIAPDSPKACIYTGYELQLTLQQIISDELRQSEARERYGVPIRTSKRYLSDIMRNVGVSLRTDLRKLWKETGGRERITEVIMTLFPDRKKRGNRPMLSRIQGSIIAAAVNEIVAQTGKSITSKEVRETLRERISAQGQQELVDAQARGDVAAMKRARRKMKAKVSKNFMATNQKLLFLTASSPSVDETANKPQHRGNCQLPALGGAGDNIIPAGDSTHTPHFYYRPFNHAGGSQEEEHCHLIMPPRPQRRLLRPCDTTDAFPPANGYYGEDHSDNKNSKRRKFGDEMDDAGVRKRHDEPRQEEDDDEEGEDEDTCLSTSSFSSDANPMQVQDYIIESFASSSNTKQEREISMTKRTSSLLSLPGADDWFDRHQHQEQEHNHLLIPHCIVSMRADHVKEDIVSHDAYYCWESAAAHNDHSDDGIVVGEEENHEAEETDEDDELLAILEKVACAGEGGELLYYPQSSSSDSSPCDGEEQEHQQEEQQQQHAQLLQQEVQQQEQQQGDQHICQMQQREVVPWYHQQQEQHPFQQQQQQQYQQQQYQQQQYQQQQYQQQVVCQQQQLQQHSLFRQPHHPQQEQQHQHQHHQQQHDYPFSPPLTMMYAPSPAAVNYDGDGGTLWPWMNADCYYK